MQIIRDLDGLRRLDLDAEAGLATRSVVAVGVFDGMHLGHQRLIHELLGMAADLQAAPTVISFANHPDEILDGAAPPPLISVPHRLRLLRRCGVQRLVLLTFSEQLREMSAERFATDILCDRLHTRGLLLGFDSAVGKDREGTPAWFRARGAELGFEVHEARPVEVDGAPISSTRIRAAISSGDLDTAFRLLGRRPAAYGTVVHGDHRGRDLGFPTANIFPEDQVLPPPGVYAVEILHEGEEQRGVANLGRRPTFDGAVAEHPLLLEVHFLDQGGEPDLYGKTLEVSFVQLIRDVRRFADASALRAQIGQDVQAARRLFAS